MEALNIIISNNSGKPIYEQITQQVKAAIMKGELSPGDPLPSMRVLAKELRISVITTKRAYEDLPALLREARLREVEEHLERAVEAARTGGIALSELQETLALLYGEPET